MGGTRVLPQMRPSNHSNVQIYLWLYIQENGKSAYYGKVVGRVVGAICCDTGIKYFDILRWREATCFGDGGDTAVHDADRAWGVDVPERSLTPAHP